MLENISFFEISALSASVPLIYGTIYFKKLSLSIRLILCFLAFSLVIDFINFFSAQFLGSNSALINLYIIIQTVLIGLYFNFSPTTDKIISKTHKIIFILFLLAVIIAQLTMNVDPRFNTYAVCISSIGIILHCGAFLVDMMKNDLGSSLIGNQHFFIVSSLLVYHACVFTIFLTFGILDLDLKKEIWNIKLVAYIVFNIFIFIALLIPTQIIEECES